jgi:transposase
MSKMKEKSRQRRVFTPEFKADVVRLVRDGKKIPEAARDMGLPATCVRNWVRQAEVDAGRGSELAMTTAEKEQLRQLQRENRQLRMERDILKKATAFFARENP